MKSVNKWRGDYIKIRRSIKAIEVFEKSQHTTEKNKYQLFA